MYKFRAKLKTGLLGDMEKKDPSKNINGRGSLKGTEYMFFKLWVTTPSWIINSDLFIFKNTIRTELEQN